MVVKRVCDWLDLELGSLTAESVAVGSLQERDTNAAIQTAWDGLVVPVADGVGVESAIDPATTTTPVQDALDVIGPTTGGAVLLPPTSVDEDGSLTGHKMKQILGWGINISEINFTNTGPMVSQDPNVSRDGQSSYWSGLSLTDGNPSNRTGAALYWNESNPRAFNIGRLRIDNLGSGAPAAIRPDTTTPFDCDWGYVEILRCNTLGLYADGSEGFGTGISVGKMIIDMAADANGFDFSGGGRLHIGDLQVENGVQSIILNPQSSGVVNIDNLGVERHISGTVREAVQASNPGTTRIGHFELINGTYDDAVMLTGYSQNKLIGPVNVRDAATVNNGKVRIFNAPNGPVRIWDSVADVNNSGGSTAEMVWSEVDQKYADPVDSVTGLQAAAGGTATASFTNLTAVADEIAPDDLDVTVAGRGGASDVGYAIDKVWYDESAGNWKAQISETEAATSITVDIEVQR